MTPTQFTESGDGLVRRYEYDDLTVIAADLGVDESVASVDVLDETAIVVIGEGENAVQRELELPAGRSAKGFINNGIVTIEVEQ